MNTIENNETLPEKSEDESKGIAGEDETKSGRDKKIDDEKEKRGRKRKRPSIYQIKSILKEVDSLSFATFGALASARKRKDICNYLNLLVRDLGWLSKKKHLFPAHRLRTFTRYELTEKGRAFLKLFPPQEEKNEDEQDSKAKENEGRLLQRPSLFVILGILNVVKTSPQKKVRFAQLACCTPELRNRNRIVLYLRFLVEELGWLEKREETHSTLWNPTKNTPMKQWKVSFYTLSELGVQFLSLFPRKSGIPPQSPEDNPAGADDEGLPSPEEQAKNWELFKRGEWNIAPVPEVPGIDGEIIQWFREKKRRQMMGIR
jgi:hypothetical protein